MKGALAGVLAGVLGLLSALAVGCGGSSKLLATSDAQELKAALTGVQQAVDGGNCVDTGKELTRVHRLVGALPGTVDRGLRQNLRQEVDGTLAPRARFECKQAVTTTIPTITSTPPVGPTQSAPPATSTATTATTPPPPETTSTATPAPTTSTPTATTPSTPTDGTGGFGATTPGTGG